MIYDPEFAIRLADICGTGKAANVQRLLNIPYQSAKNYLNGRLPRTDALIRIAQITGCTIDWLLTGEGKKFRTDARLLGAPISAGQFDESVRKICVEVINEMNGKTETAHPRIVRLQSSEVLSEKVPDEVIASTGKKP